jgi:hypothetical protein
VLQQVENRISQASFNACMRALCNIVPVKVVCMYISGGRSSVDFESKGKSNLKCIYDILYHTF